MKKTKKLLSALLSLSIFASVMPISVNATILEGDGDYYPGCIDLGDLKYFYKDEKIVKFYYDPEINYIFGIEPTDNAIILQPKDNESIEVINQTLFDAGIPYGAYKRGFYMYHSECGYIIDDDPSYEEAVKISSILKEKDLISDFIYMGNRHFIRESEILMLPLTCYGKWDGNKEEFEAYAKENDLKCAISDESIIIDPDDELPWIEKFELLNEVEIKTNFYCPIGFLEAAGDENSSDIDMANNTPGDANADEILDIADAVMIMQSISNPDEYQLTAQGRYNADIAGDNDGITVEDALAIQKKLTGLE